MGTPKRDSKTLLEEKIQDSAFRRLEREGWKTKPLIDHAKGKYSAQKDWKICFGDSYLDLVKQIFKRSRKTKRKVSYIVVKNFRFE